MIRSPLDLAHPALSARAVVFARLLTGVWLLTGHVAALPTVGVPLLGGLSVLHGHPAWRVMLLYLSALGVVLVWATPAVRTGCALVAASIGLALLGDLAWFSNNRLLTGLLLALVALAREPAHDRWLLWQLAIVWLGAAWDKTWDADWRSGQVLVALVDELQLRGQLWSPGGAHPEPTALAVALRGLPLAGLSWAVVALEWAVGLAFLRGHPAAWWLSAAFFAGLVALTGSTMGMFVYVGLLGGLLVHPRAGDLRVWLVPVGLLATPLFSWPLLAGLLALLAAHDAATRGSRPTGT